MARSITRSVSPVGTQDTSVVQMQGSPSSQTNSAMSLNIFVIAKKIFNVIFRAIKKFFRSVSPVEATSPEFNVIFPAIKKFFNANSRIIQKRKELEEVRGRLDSIDEQMNIIAQEIKDKMTEMMAPVKETVSYALSKEITQLYMLVDEFEYAFNPEISFLNVYKTELRKHVEHRLGSNTRARLSNALSMSIKNMQNYMAELFSSLLPPEYKQQILNVSHRDFEVLCSLNCDGFNEDIEFHFSPGLSSIINRLFSPHDGRLELSYIDPQQAPLTINQEVALASPSLIALGATALTSLSGFLAHTVGWRPIAVGAISYGGLYVYEKLRWTEKQERILKKQFVQYTTRNLQLQADITSAYCSVQVQQELSFTFDRLCRVFDEAKTDMQTDISRLNNEISELQRFGNLSNILRNTAGYLHSEMVTFTDYLIREIDAFTEHYLPCDD